MATHPIKVQDLSTGRVRTLSVPNASSTATVDDLRGLAQAALNISDVPLSTIRLIAGSGRVGALNRGLLKDYLLDQPGAIVYLNRNGVASNLASCGKWQRKRELLDED
jgi:hypothetical protein